MACVSIPRRRIDPAMLASVMFRWPSGIAGAGLFVSFGAFFWEVITSTNHLAAGANGTWDGCTIQR